MARFVAAALASLRLTAGDLIYMGSGGCDGDDPSCKNDPAAQKVLRAIEVGSGIVWPVPQHELSLTQEGLPAWLTLHRECMFVVRPDKDDIIGYKIGHRGQLITPGQSSWSGGRNPVHATVSVDSRFLVVANYDGPDDLKKNSGATIASLRIGDECSLSVVDYKNHTGHSVNPDRQSAAHVHSAYALSNGYIYSCDLGLDFVFTYQLSDDGKLQEVHRTKTQPGLGPRHIVQHPKLPVMYVVCEMGQVVLTYKMEDDGTLTLLQTSSVVKEGDSGDGSKAAELAMLPDGTRLFATNRGKLNTVTAFDIAPDSGKLTFGEQVEAPAFPRGMTIAEGGRKLVVGGQSKSEVWVYSTHDGGLKRVSVTNTKNCHGCVAANVATFAVLKFNEQPLQV